MRVLPAVILAVAMASPAWAGSSTPLRLDLFDAVVDEHDTNAFYGRSGFCAGSEVPLQDSAFAGDGQSAGAASAWNAGGLWTEATGLSSTAYVNNSNCGTSCLRAEFRPGNKLVFDTRGTTGPRAMSLSLAQPCGPSEGCPGPAGDPTALGGAVTTPALLNVFLDSSFTSMAVCTSRGCPEGQPAFAKLWFDDPAASDVTWRVDWANLRVLRVSSSTWYLVGDVCDGTQVAGLSKLTGRRSRPKTVFNGYYKIPFFMGALRLSPLEGGLSGQP